MLRVELWSATGENWLLSGSQVSSAVLAPEGALAGLVGAPTREDLAVPARAGVIPGRRQWGAIVAEVPFFLHADDGDELEDVYRRFRRGWSLSRPSTVMVAADHPAGRFMLDVVLERPIAGVGVDARRRTSVEVTVPMVATSGLWRSMPFSASGEIRVLNSGDDWVFPTVRARAGGGRVVCPSGASFEVDRGDVVDLDPARLRVAGVFPEGVPPGSEASWQVPDGVALEWEIRVADPFA